MRRVNKRQFILLVTCPLLPSFVYPPSAPALLLQGVPLHTGAPHVTLTGDAGGGGVLKEFASPDASSLQIQATRGGAASYIGRFGYLLPKHSSSALAAFIAEAYLDRK